MKTEEAKKQSITERPIVGKSHTLYPGTLGHRHWLIERKNASFVGGEVTVDSVVELCFAYTTNPEKLQSITGAKASAAIRKFKINLADEDFGNIQDHVFAILQRAKLTATSPKKKPVQNPAQRKKACRARRQ